MTCESAFCAPASQQPSRCLPKLSRYRYHSIRPVVVGTNPCQITS
ncbi:MAG: hypothetical protein IIC22_04340 [Chloroflexi bacterium]|nr:hypothetical protein [Chloroflexota bacterium]